MRRFGLLAAVVTLAAGRLAAQHAGQVEVGAFGSYTRYDATFGLAHKIGGGVVACIGAERDRKSTRLNSSHDQISYAVFCLKKKKNIRALPLSQSPPIT